MDNQKNRLKKVLEAQNADTARLKKQLKSSGIPSSTLWKYINHPETEISATHAAIIIKVTNCTLNDLIVDNSTLEEPANFELSKTA